MRRSPRRSKTFMALNRPSVRSNSLFTTVLLTWRLMECLSPRRMNTLLTVTGKRQKGEGDSDARTGLTLTGERRLRNRWNPGKFIREILLSLFTKLDFTHLRFARRPGPVLSVSRTV